MQGIHVIKKYQVRKGLYFENHAILVFRREQECVIAHVISHPLRPTNRALFSQSAADEWRPDDGHTKSSAPDFSAVIHLFHIFIPYSFELFLDRQPLLTELRFYRPTTELRLKCNQKNYAFVGHSEIMHLVQNKLYCINKQRLARIPSICYNVVICYRPNVVPNSNHYSVRPTVQRPVCSRSHTHTHNEPMAEQ